MSSAPSVSDVLSAYLAGTVPAERLVAVVAAAYYREPGKAQRETWRPILDVAERAHPGVVELAASPAQPGFAVRLAERSLPRRYEAELRAAVEQALHAQSAFPVSRVPLPDAPRSWLSRMAAAMRRLFTASP